MLLLPTFAESITEVLEKDNNVLLTSIGTWYIIYIKLRKRSGKMGNSVSAEAGVNLPNIESNSNPPPECPMHKKTDPKPEETKKPSECPVQGNDVNPYNMVSVKARSAS